MGDIANKLIHLKDLQQDSLTLFLEFVLLSARTSKFYNHLEDLALTKIL